VSEHASPSQTSSGRTVASADVVRASISLTLAPGAALGGGAAPASGSAKACAPRRGTSRSEVPAAGVGHGLALIETSSHGSVEVLFAESRQRRAKRSVMTSARLLEEDRQRGGFRGRTAFYRLSYASTRDVAPRDISRCLKLLRRRFGEEGRLAYVWRGELGEEKGRFHYHLIVWLSLRACPLKYERPPYLDRMGIWTKGSTNSVWARSAAGYLAKYCAKKWEGDFPVGMRTHGSGGLSDRARRERRWWMLPSYVREAALEVEDDWRRRPGGGFLAWRTGEVVRSRYRWEAWIWGAGPSGKKCRIGARFVEVEDAVQGEVYAV
jgi:hypothetical protein